MPGLKRVASTLSCATVALALSTSTNGSQDAVSAMLTVPERTGYAATSTYADVSAFLDAIARASPRVHVKTFGKTVEGRTLPLAVIGAPDASPDAVRKTGKLRVYIQGNIHGGEVEGKESAQMLIRALAAGAHDAWLDRIVFLIAPIYNADGNERFALDNRGPQHGPMRGQGQRPNAQNLDLNRDHMKLDSPEARAFVGLLNDYDPHVSFDLHTTNGTRHAYWLTYSPPLHPATYAPLTALLRGEWLPSVTKRVKARFGWAFFYYGNAAPATRSGDGAASSGRRWETFDHRPRFNNNYVGLRNRVALLSEAYAYATFADRITATNRFLEEALAFAATHAARIQQLTASADRERLPGKRLPLRAELEHRGPIDILMGDVVEEKHPVDGHVMHRRQDVSVPERMADYTTFKGIEPERVPSAYYVPPTLTDAIDRLRAHGIAMRALQSPVTLTVEAFRIDTNQLAAAPFQTHRERTLTGTWRTSRRELPAGTLTVDMTQPRARLAFYLLEPRSDDGLLNWNLLDAAVAEAKEYPVLRGH